jgi:hypothetical protein
MRFAPDLCEKTGKQKAPFRLLEGAPAVVPIICEKVFSTLEDQEFQPTQLLAEAGLD